VIEFLSKQPHPKPATNRGEGETWVFDALSATCDLDFIQHRVTDSEFSRRERAEMGVHGGERSLDLD
jgi:hypothetical protein